MDKYIPLSLKTLCRTPLHGATSTERDKTAEQKTAERKTVRFHSERKILPDIDSIRRNHREGRLLSRAIRPYEPDALKIAQPRPFAGMRHGLPVNIQSLFIDKFFIGAIAREELLNHMFKIDAYTTLEGVPKKRVAQLMNIDELNLKLDEQNARIEPLYPVTTSGHYNRDRVYKSGHRKESPLSLPLENSEIVVNNLSKIQPCCYFLPLRGYSNFKDLGTYFHHLAEFLEFNELTGPLISYDGHRGMLGEEVDYYNLKTSPEELEKNCEMLHIYSNSIGYDSRNLYHLLAFGLPFPKFLGLIAKLPHEVESMLKASGDVLALKEFIIKMDWPSIIQWLDSNKADKPIFFHKGYTFNILELILYSMPLSLCESILQGKNPDLLHTLSSVIAPRIASTHSTGSGSLYIFQIAIHNLLVQASIKQPDEDALLLLYGVKKSFDPVHIHTLTQNYISAAWAASNSQEEYQEKLDLLLTGCVREMSKTTPEELPDSHPVRELFAAGAGNSTSAWEALAEKITTCWLGAKPPSLIIESLDPKKRASYISKFESDNKAKTERSKRWISLLEPIRDAAIKSGSGQSKTTFIRSKSKTLTEKVFPASDTQTPCLQWISDLFAAPLLMNPSWSYEELSQAVVSHYYQRPWPEQTTPLLEGRCKIDRLRELHGPDHAVRTQIYAEAMSGLFNGYPPFDDLISRYGDLLELIPLAELYHDVYAEVEGGGGIYSSKENEEIKAAEYFEADIIQLNRYPEHLIKLVGSALRNKNTNLLKNVEPPYVADSLCSPEERLLRSIIRLPDSMDVIRDRKLSATYPYPERKKQRDLSVFDSGRLDISDELKANPAFMQKLYAMLEGGRDLASVSGGLPREDRNPAGSYSAKHGLTMLDNNLRKRKVERCPNTRDCLLEILDDNVRRTIAFHADITTCGHLHDKSQIRAGKQPACQVQMAGQTKLIRIHSDIELKQVRLPADMSIFEKLTYGYLPDHFLSGSTHTSIQHEISRLKEEGIKPPEIGPDQKHYVIYETDKYRLDPCPHCVPIDRQFTVIKKPSES